MDAGIGGGSDYTFTLQLGERRREAEAFVHASFAQAHGARVRHYMPQLYALRDAGGGIGAVCGLRPAALERLFLETYLDAPVERLLGRRCGAPVERAAIIEVGNLAVRRGGLARRLICSLTGHLHAEGYGWTVFSAVPLLRNAFLRLGVLPMELACADPLRLPPEQRADWGNYYASRPMVMAVAVGQARTALGPDCARAA